MIPILCVCVRACVRMCVDMVTVVTCHSAIELNCVGKHAVKIVCSQGVMLTVEHQFWVII